MAEPVSVRVLDASGRPVPDVVVQFDVPSSSGSLSPASAKSGSDGVAQTVWTLGTAPGQQTILASTTGVPPLTLTATARPGPVARLEKRAGDEQVVAPDAGRDCPAQFTLAADLSVRALDRYDNPVDGAPISWTPTTGAASPSTGNTDALGIASAQWTVQNELGAHALTASAPGGASTAFRATVRSGIGKRLLYVRGDRQTGRPGETLPIPLTVRVTDNCGVPVEGATVLWQRGGPGTMNPIESRTAANGDASSFWTLDTVPGTTATGVLFRYPGGVYDFTFTATITSP
ncbi:MAG: Ig-like domain-containing protein [Gemmatimonadetes bacterium]|nr:Ig-like domain-containing protein [Gemmatimonadota bacterium]